VELGDNLQSTQGENGNQTQFLLSRQPQTLQDWHWQGPDGQIGDDVESREAEENGLQTNAVSTFYAVVPIVLNRPTGQARCEDQGDATSGDECDQDPYCASIASLNEKSEVLVEN
jgi:hypothetical protein